MLLYLRLSECAVNYATCGRPDGTFAACVGFLDRPDVAGRFQRVQTIYRREGLRSRSAARRHAEARQLEIVVRPDVLRTYAE